MRFDTVRGFELHHAGTANDKSNTPPSKRQKVAERERDPVSITLQLKSKSGESTSSTPNSHESNCYRSITNFVGALIDGKLTSHVRIQSLQSSVRDLMRIYGKSADIYNFILREVRRGLATFKPQSTSQQNGFFIHTVIRTWTRAENWMRVIRYVFADLDRSYATKSAGTGSLQAQIEHLFREVILNDINIHQWLFADLRNCLVAVRQSLNILTTGNTTSINSAIHTSTQLNELLQVHELFQIARTLDWQLEAIGRVYLDTMDDVIEQVSHQAIEQSLAVKDVIDKVYAHDAFECAISKRIDENYDWDYSKHIANTYFKLSFDTLIAPNITQLVPFTWNKSAVKNTLEYDSIPSITQPETALTKRLYEIANHTSYKGQLEGLLLSRINDMIKAFVADEDNDQYLILALIGTLRDLNAFYSELYDIPTTSSYSQYKESFAKGLQYRANKPAEMIAKFLDSLLKDKRGQGDTMEKLVDGAVELFRIVKDKDMFSAFYTLSLARRLVKSTTASNDNERELISRITKVAGADFTQNWEEMMKDVEISQELSDKFRDSRNTRLQKANIVQAARWPFTGQHLSLRVRDMADKDASEVAKQAHLSQGDVMIPQWMTEELVEFTKYYQGVHANRCLTWNHSLAEVTLSSEFEAKDGTKSSKEIIMPLPASLILMVFNDKEDDEKVSYAEIAQSTGLSEGELKRMLQSLSFGKVKLLQRFKKKEAGANNASNASKDVDSSDTFAVVKVLEHPRKRFRLPIITADVDVEESKETAAEVESARVFALQASAVRVLKARKKINVNELIHEVIADIEKRLTLSNETGLTKQIKQTIEGLIEKDYAERIEGQRNMLQYVA